MGEVVFMDTTVLLNVLNVPGNTNSVTAHDVDIKRLGELVRAGAQLVLPLTTIIETGNAIAKVTADRNRYVDQFVRFLRSSLTSEAPWLATGETTNAALLSRMVDGGDVKLADLMRTGVGTGDAAIIAEVAELKTRIPSATPVSIWTHDKGLSAYA